MAGVEREEVRDGKRGGEGREGGRDVGLIALWKLDCTS